LVFHITWRIIHVAPNLAEQAAVDVGAFVNLRVRLAGFVNQPQERRRKCNNIFKF
jgi:hypothetical protein